MTDKRILIIDDEADVREIAKVSLEITKHWQVTTAASGDEGLALASSCHPDAILLDVVMPQVDGLATLIKLRENMATCHIPVILLTATIRLATQPAYAAAGAKAILVKPFDPGLLGSQIETALGW
ncbi:MAG: two-component system response regulator [Leptolyngbya sp.]|jgi:CheY-like chemotaxis protein|uniref:Two-component system response regulator n=1 Tax=Shackletoniella antarctica TaxID=268115 RepID=A0A2W4WDL9_9CYAN|nr:MAG: two-component system response regulator [Shackletoniella antarctica]PZV15587.1 MAG: two-component system response regulator [Leptolyngbya sp.]